MTSLLEQALSICQVVGVVSCHVSRQLDFQQKNGVKIHSALQMAAAANIDRRLSCPDLRYTTCSWSVNVFKAPYCHSVALAALLGMLNQAQVEQIMQVAKPAAC